MASIVSESGNKEADKFTFTDIDLNPITVDNNPAHFDGSIHSISEFCQRTGKFLPLVISLPTVSLSEATKLWLIHPLPSPSSRTG